MATSVISSASAVAAASYAPTFGGAVSAGDTIMVGVSTTGTGITITGVTDSQGNTYVMVLHTNNGAAGNDCWIGICTGAKALTISDTLTVSTSGGNFSSVTVRADTFTGAMTVVNTPTMVSTTTIAFFASAATTNATQQIWAWDQQFTSTTVTTSNYVLVDVTFTRTAVRCNTASNNAACSGWSAPGAATGTCTAKFSWDASHAGNATVVVLDNASTAHLLALTGAGA